MCPVADGKVLRYGWTTGSAFRGALLACVLATVANGCRMGRSGRPAAESESRAPLDPPMLIAEMASMRNEFPLHLSIAVRAVENARVARNAAESRRLDAAADIDGYPNPLLTSEEHEAHAALREAFSRLDAIVLHMKIVEAYLDEALRIVDGGDDVTRPAVGEALSRRDYQRLQLLHAQARDAGAFIADAVSRLKARWLLPVFDQGDESGDKP